MSVTDVEFSLEEPHAIEYEDDEGKEHKEWMRFHVLHAKAKVNGALASEKQGSLLLAKPHRSPFLRAVRAKDEQGRP